MSSSLNDLERDYYNNAGSSLIARFGGGKSAYTGNVTAVGDSTIITPSVGKSIRIYWVYAIANPDSPTTQIAVKIGAMTIYTGFGISHWETFTGNPNDAVVINLSVGSNVAVTVHYAEV